MNNTVKMQCTVQYTVYRSEQYIVYCEVEFRGGIQWGVFLKIQVILANNFDGQVPLFVLYSVQCSVQYRVLHSVQYIAQLSVSRNRYVGCHFIHSVIPRKPMKTKLAKYSHVQKKPKFIIITILYFSLVQPISFFGQNRWLFSLQCDDK